MGRRLENILAAIRRPLLLGSISLAALTFSPKEAHSQKIVDDDNGKGGYVKVNKNTFDVERQGDEYIFRVKGSNQSNSVNENRVVEQNGNYYIKRKPAFSRGSQGTNNNQNYSSEREGSWFGRNADWVIPAGITVIGGIMDLVSKNNSSENSTKNPDKDNNAWDNNKYSQGSSTDNAWTDNSYENTKDSYNAWTEDKSGRGDGFGKNDNPWNEGGDWNRAEGEAKEFFGGYGIKANKEWQYELGQDSRTASYLLLDYLPIVGDMKALKERFSGPGNPIENWYNKNLSEANTYFYGKEKVNPASWKKDCYNCSGSNDISKIILYKILEEKE